MEKVEDSIDGTNSSDEKRREGLDDVMLESIVYGLRRILLLRKKPLQKFRNGLGANVYLKVDVLFYGISVCCCTCSFWF